jgi:beta-phosphoglucomutase-like phosphatase (HAD superfamily)
MTLDPLYIGPAAYDAVLFDLDGVLTPTAALHARCWKQALDPVLAEQARRTGRPQAPFDEHAEYLRHVDGKPREDGVRDLMGARGILAGAEAVRVIADHKQRLVAAALDEGVIDPFPGRSAGCRSCARPACAPRSSPRRSTAPRCCAPPASSACSS